MRRGKHRTSSETPNDTHDDTIASVGASAELLEDVNDADYVPPSKRGVLFFSSLPRDMHPHEVCQHFARFGRITRQRFTPFPTTTAPSSSSSSHSTHKSKSKSKTSAPQFMNAYVEFAHAEDAARAAAAMNGTAVECRRRRRCHGQLWTVRYDAGVSWDALRGEREDAARRRRAAVVAAVAAERAGNEAYRRAAAAAMARGAGTRKRRRMEEGMHE